MPRLIMAAAPARFVSPRKSCRRVSPKLAGRQVRQRTASQQAWRGTGPHFDRLVRIGTQVTERVVSALLRVSEKLAYGCRAAGSGQAIAARAARRLAVVLLLLAGTLTSETVADDAAAPAKLSPRDLQFFETRIRPVLVKHCYRCHSAKAEELGGGLLLDSRAGVLKGGETGPAIVPGKPAQSLLISSLEFRDFEMPPEGKLPDDVIADFKRWVRIGAPDPRDGEMPVTDRAETKETPRGELWSLQPVTRPDVPQETGGWVRSDVDQFVAAAWKKQGLKPVGDTRAPSLLRRLYFDLIGLPPSPEEQVAFAAGFAVDRQLAIEDVVDRLFASPQFGERWGRHWLDVVRYAESAGNSRDVLMPCAWRYRDYVIDALNADVPFDRFVTEQIAGDLLPAESPAERDRLTIATGLLAVGSKSLNGGNVDLDLVDDQIDVIGKAVLGLSVSCARCHDHKFDPIPTADYYALAGIFRSTETFYGGSTQRPKTTADKLKVYLPLGPDADATAKQIAEHDAETAELSKQQAALTKTVQQLQKKLPKDWKERKQQLAEKAGDSNSDAAADTPQEGDAAADSGQKKQRNEDGGFAKQLADFEAAQQELQNVESRLKELQAVELPELEFAVGVRDAKKIADWPIQIRGERAKAGDIVPRRFLSCVHVAHLPQIESKKSSGRVELAAWLTQPDHPLTPRVFVNRVWQHLFGRGLVETVDNFGVNGQPPTHPELLDWLARHFVDDLHWSTKALIRELVLTRTYQLASDLDAASYELDPANTFYWRMSRRRLEAEPLRDSLLAASGNLKLDRPYASAVAEIGEGEVGRGINTKPLTAPFPHRSVYLPILRTAMSDFLKAFDLPEPSNPQGLRDATNVPAQSLYLMNNEFVIEQARGTAQRVLKAEAEDAKRLALLFRICLARTPSGSEVARFLEFLDRTARDLQKKHPDDAERAELTWTILSQTLFASAEFRYVE
ncbi:DUF1553 domain-containing protein [bacterium]|nr:DUF1553 domain-containing protein [bacterium]